MKKINITISSPSFYPNIGGIENTAYLLAKYYKNKGHNVTVITYTKSPQIHKFCFNVVRNPSIFKLFNIIRNTDIFHQVNVSLKTIWAYFLLKNKNKCLIISHHTSFYDLNGKIIFLNRIKKLISIYAFNISCSNYINNLLPKKGVVINSPYDETTFYRDNTIEKKRDLVFLGRLVSDKGCNLILEAIKKLKEESIYINLSIIGEGPEKSNLENLTKKLDIGNQINFFGSLSGKKLNNTLNEHKILVIPSIWEEPFGKVALEGLAAGCKVITANSGGLKEAAGPTGIIFESKNSTDLAEKIRLTLLNAVETTQEIDLVSVHLSNHSAVKIGEKYYNTIVKFYLNRL